MVKGSCTFRVSSVRINAFFEEGLESSNLVRPCRRFDDEICSGIHGVWVGPHVYEAVDELLLIDIV